MLAQKWYRESVYREDGESGKRSDRWVYSGDVVSVITGALWQADIDTPDLGSETGRYRRVV